MAAEHVRASAPLAVIAPGNDTMADLRAVGARAEDVTAALDTADLRAYAAVLVAGDLAPAVRAADRLRAYVAGGGRVLLHGVRPEQSDLLRQLLGTEAAVEAAAAGRFAIAGHHGITDGLANEDIYWQTAAVARRPPRSAARPVRRPRAERPRTARAVRAGRGAGRQGALAD